MENGKIDYLYDFKKDFIVVDEYDQLIFEKVYLLKDNDKWESINKLMEHEYLLEWVKFLKKNNIINKEKNKQTDLTVVNDINKYDICEVFDIKLDGLMRENSIRELYDICFIYNKFKNRLKIYNLKRLENFFNNMNYDPIDYFNYLWYSQNDQMINYGLFKKLFIDMIEDLSKQ